MENNMDIKLVNSDTKYSEIHVEHEYLVNGKTIRVSESKKQDMLFTDYDSETTINADDLKLLSEDELEALEQLMWGEL